MLPSRRARAAAAALVATLLAVGGTAAADTTPPTSPTPSTGPTSAAPPAAPAAAPAEILAPTPLTGAEPGPDVPAGLAATLAPLLRSAAIGGRAAMSVVDVASGTEVYESFGGRPQPPASTLKVLTALAVLRALGPQARLTTRVVAGLGNGVVLVGAGDQTLTREPARSDTDGLPQTPASLTELAAATAAALRASGRDTVRLRFDDGAFSGPRTAVGWPPSYVATGVVSPVSALAADGGRVAAGAISRSADPAAAAAAYFADRLRAEGITVRGEPRRDRAPSGAAVVAEVRSPTIAAQVERMLTISDNDLAEALARLAGGAQGDASFTGAAAAVRDTLVALGLPDRLVATVRVADGSGLSLRDAVPASVLAHVLAAAAPAAAYWPVVTGLPVAGLTGTLAARFAGPAAAGRGLVRAKTGTLTGTTALAGTVRDDTGRVLAFAVLADRVVAKYAAEAAVDRIAAALVRP